MINVFYLILILGLFTATVLTGSIICLITACVLSVLLLVSVIMVKIASKKCILTLDAPKMSEKGKEITVTLNAEKTGRIPLGGLTFDFVCENRLTGERMKTPVHGKRDRWIVTSEYCGCLCFSLEKIRFKDWFGVFTCRKGEAVSCKTIIVPETFEVNVSNEFVTITQNDTEEFSHDRKGQDRSETFQIRDYVPGDALSTIHWKLSSKLGSLIVRDASLPVDHSLIIFWNRSRQKKSPKAQDALFEAMASVASSYAEAGFNFTLAWNEDVLNTLVVESKEAASESISYMLNANEISELSGFEMFSRRFVGNEGGRVIIFNEGDENEVNVLEFNGNKKVFICSDDEAYSESYEITYFTAENAEEMVNNSFIGGDI